MMRDLWKRTMRKLLLLDADDIIDLHTFGLFGRITKAYDLCLTQEVFEEAKYYKKDGTKIEINLKNVLIIDNVDLEILRWVQREAKQAMLGIDPGESTSIAYLSQTDEEITFCTCDKAAIKLMSYMELEQKAISLPIPMDSSTCSDSFRPPVPKIIVHLFRDGSSI